MIRRRQTHEHSIREKRKRGKHPKGKKVVGKPALNILVTVSHVFYSPENARIMFVHNITKTNATSRESENQKEPSR